MPTRFVASTIDENKALDALRPKRSIWARLGRGSRSGLDGKRLPYLELVWLPFLHLEDGERSCVVCASTGLAASFDRTTASFGRGGVVAAAALDRDELVEIGRSHLARVAAMAGGGRADAEPPTERSLKNAEPEDWALPFWILHYERRRGRLDFAALDALSGAKVGGALRQALLRALIRRPDGLR